MANKGKRETKKQVTEVKQELQKELDKMGRVHSNISTQQVEEPSTRKNKSTVEPSTPPTLSGRTKSVNLDDNNDIRIRPKSATYNQEAQGNQNSSLELKFTKEKEENKEKEKRKGNYKGRPKGAKDKNPRKKRESKQTDENNTQKEKRKVNYKGRPKGAKDKQPRKKRNVIEEAQQKLEQRREELERVSQNTEGFEDDIYLYDEDKKMQFQTKTEYGQAFYIGEVVEQALYEMCAVARTYSWTVPDRIFFVENTVRESKERYGEKTFYNNLWNKQGETLENCQTIVMSSKGQDVSRQVQRVKTLLLDIPYDEIEIDD